MTQHSKDHQLLSEVYQNIIEAMTPEQLVGLMDQAIKSTQSQGQDDNELWFTAAWKQYQILCKQKGIKPDQAELKQWFLDTAAVDGQVDTSAVTKFAQEFIADYPKNAQKLLKAKDWDTLFHILSTARNDYWLGHTRSDIEMLLKKVGASDADIDYVMDLPAVIYLEQG